MKKKCMEYTYCGLKDKPAEYFSKLNSVKVELKKKKSAQQEIEAQIKSLDDFTTGSEYSFVKNLTPRMFAADRSYKAKLMHNVRLLQTFLDGNIQAVTANDNEQLRILISKYKKNVGIPYDTDVDTWAKILLFTTPRQLRMKPDKRTERTNKSKRLDQHNKKKNKCRKPKKTKKVKKKIEDENTPVRVQAQRTDMKSMYNNNTNPGFATTFPYFNPIHSTNYNLQYITHPTLTFTRLLLTHRLHVTLVMDNIRHNVEIMYPTSQ